MIVVLLAISTVLLIQKKNLEYSSDIIIDSGAYYHIRTKDGISVDIPKSLNLKITQPIFSNGYTYYALTSKTEEVPENKITFYLFQDNTDTNYSLYPQYSGKIYFYGDGSVDMSNVHLGALKNYRTLETITKFRNNSMSQYTHDIFDVIPEKGVSIVSFGYTRNNESPSNDLDVTWESIRSSLYIPENLLKETYGDVSLVSS
ncbi:hypothetical protein HY249_02700 [Candidatus Azambacteria bacterium]|nr:hypothetical protein [Candidatus Azambacteria bacterium]